MIIKGIISEDIVNYKKIAMVIEFPYCDFKCDRDAGCSVCQNSQLSMARNYDIPMNDIISSYIDNPITEAIVMQGLEPFDSWEDLLELINKLRTMYECDDDIVIYTGYNKEEVSYEIDILRSLGFKNIIVKFGRYVPGDTIHFDKVLGVNLASDNQYAEVIS